MTEQERADNAARMLELIRQAATVVKCRDCIYWQNNSYRTRFCANQLSPNNGQHTLAAFTCYCGSKGLHA